MSKPTDDKRERPQRYRVRVLPVLPGDPPDELVVRRLVPGEPPVYEQVMLAENERNPR